MACRGWRRCDAPGLALNSYSDTTMSETRKVLLSSTTKHLMRSLGEFANEADFQGAIEVIRDAMTASTRVRMQQRDLKGNLQYEDIPDHRVRLAAAALFLECTVVKPVKLLELNGGGDGGGNKPPASEDALVKMMMGGDWERVKEIGDLYHEGFKKAAAKLSGEEAIDVTPKLGHGGASHLKPPAR